MISETILLTAVAALQLTNTVSNIVMTMATSRNKYLKELNDELKDELKLEKKNHKKTKEDLAQMKDQYGGVYAELQEKIGRLNQLDNVPMRNFTHQEAV